MYKRQEYKEQEFTEKWSYELAALYYKAGEKQKCLDLCNEIILWFSEGKYVMKSYDLKMRMGELTGAEKAKYEKQFIPKLITPEQAKELKKQETESESEQQEDETVKESGDSKEQTEEIQKIEVMEESEEKAPAKPIDMASMQAQISKNIKDIFGGKSLERENFTEESVDMIDGAGITKEDEIPEEIIKSDVSEKEPENVPELEAEPEKPGEAPVAVPAENNSEKAQEKENPVDFGATIKMPELNIPDSMKNMELSKAPKVEDVAGSFASASIDFNLEDTILAAANAQGIEIPKEETEEETQGEALQNSDKSNELEEPDFLSENIIEESEPDETPTVEDYVETGEPVLQEEEEVTEEDLRRAEAEFLHGPVDNADLNLEDIEDSDLDTEELVSAPEAENEEPLSEEEELERFIESIQSKDETDPRNLVPREKELTDDEKQLFTYFVKVPGMKEQLVDTLCDVQMAAADKTSKTGNIIVMGGKECGKTRLISGLIPAICKELNLEASKVAYVFAEQINGKNIYKIFAKLAGGFLVIENANQLTQETVEMLDKAMEVNTDGLTVIVEDEKIGMRKFIARYPKFAKKFTSMINIPVFTNDELVNFARIYTKENGYIIDQMGMLALYNLIGINQKEDLPMNIGAVKEMIDAAIAKSQGGIRKFKRNISKKRIDRDGYIVLYEKDFTK